jgi:HEAT repeat protein
MIRPLMLVSMLVVPLVSTAGAAGDAAKTLDAAVATLNDWNSSLSQRTDAMARVRNAGATAQAHVRTLLKSVVWRARYDGLALASQLRLPDLGRILSAGVRDKNWAVRVKAATLCAALPSSRRAAVRGALKTLLDDRIGSARLAAYKAFAAWSAEGPEVVQAMSDPDTEVAYWAAQQYMRQADSARISPAVRAKLIDSVIAKLRASRWTGVDNLSVVALMKLGPAAADAFHEAVMAEPADLRRAAVSAIGSRARKSAVDLMFRFATDSDQSVRQSAMGQIANHAEDRHAPQLLRLLGSSRDVQTQRHAVAALGRLKYQKAVPQIVKLLNSGDHNIRQAVLQALAGIGDRSVAPQLLTMFRKERQSWRRSQLVRPIAQLLGQEGKEFLREALRDDDQSVRSYALYSVRSLKAEDRLGMLVRVIKEDDNDRVRRTAISSLETSQVAKAIEALEVALRQGGPETRQAAASKLAEARSARAARMLIAAFPKEESPQIREVIINGLGQIKERTAVPLFKKALASDEPQMRAAALRALARIDDVLPDDFLIRIALKEESDSVLAMCISVINDRKICDPRLLAQLEKLIASPDNGVRYTAVQCLARIESSAAGKILCRVIKEDDYPTVRSHAAQMLGRQIASGKLDVDRAMLKALGEALETGDEGIRLQLVKTLGERSDVRLAPLLIKVLSRDTSAVVRREAAGAIARSADKSMVPRLLKAAEAEDRPETLAVLIRVLGGLEDRRVMPFLKTCLKATSPTVQAAALKAISGFRDASLIPFYVERFKQSSSTEVRLTSLRSLADSGDRRALPALMIGAKDEDPRIRQAAVAALADFVDGEVATGLAGRWKEPSVLKLLAAARMKPIGDDLLAAARRTDDERERTDIHLALAAMGDRRAIPDLLRAVRRRASPHDAARLFDALVGLEATDAAKVCADIAATAVGRKARLAVQAAVKLRGGANVLHHILAAMKSGPIRDKRFYAELFKRLDTDRNQVVLRQELVSALARRHDGQLVAALCSALRADEPAGRKVLARVALSEMDDAASVAAIGSLARTSGGSAAASLSLILDSERPATVRAAALAGLARMDRLSVPQALEHLRSRDTELRRAAIRSITKQTASADAVKEVADLAASSGADAVAAVEALGRAGGKEAMAAVGKLIAGLVEADPSPELVAAAGALRVTEAIRPLTGWAKAGSLEVRVVAVDALALIGSKPAMSAIEDAFAQKEVDAVRAAAARALGRSGQREYIGRLLDGLRNAKGLDVRAACADALGALGGPQSKGALIEALKHESGLVREHAVRALSRKADAKTLAVIRKLSDDPDAGVARAVRQAGRAR